MNYPWADEPYHSIGDRYPRDPGARHEATRPGWGVGCIAGLGRPDWLKRLF
jgi:hypothetical protein